MRRLRYPTNAEEAAYMRMRKKQNLASAATNQSENQVADWLAQTGISWTRQACWGYRLFDFWNHELGCAIEVDGDSHDADYDSYRDEYNFRRSAIVTLRVRNGVESDLKRAMAIVVLLPSWSKRRDILGIVGGKGQKRHLANMPYDPNSTMLAAYIANLLANPRF